MDLAAASLLCVLVLRVLGVGGVHFVVKSVDRPSKVVEYRSRHKWYIKSLHGVEGNE